MLSAGKYIPSDLSPGAAFWKTFVKSRIADVPLPMIYFPHHFLFFFVYFYFEPHHTKSTDSRGCVVYCESLCNQNEKEKKINSRIVDCVVLTPLPSIPTTPSPSSFPPFVVQEKKKKITSRHPPGGLIRGNFSPSPRPPRQENLSSPHFRRRAVPRQPSHIHTQAAVAN